MLRDLLLFLIVMGGFVYGFWLMRRLDDFTDKNSKPEEEKKKQKEFALIFGTQEEPELKKWFEKAGLEVVFTSDIHIRREWKDVRYLVALTDSDVDNLSVCSLVRRNSPGVQSYSVCNERVVKKLYRQVGAAAFFTREDLMQRMELITLEHEAGAA